MTSRLTSEDFMPAWPMAMPSVTVMVVNSRGVPPAALTPLLHRLGLAGERDVAGRRLVPGGGDADEGLGDLRLRHAHGVVVGAVRRAGRADRDVAAGQLGFIEFALAGMAVPSTGPETRRARYGAPSRSPTGFGAWHQCNYWDLRGVSGRWAICAPGMAAMTWPGCCSR